MNFNFPSINDSSGKNTETLLYAIVFAGSSCKDTSGNDVIMEQGRKNEGYVGFPILTIGGAIVNTGNTVDDTKCL